VNNSQRALCVCACLFLSLLGLPLHIITRRTYIALDFVVIAYGELVVVSSSGSQTVSQFSSAL